MTSAPPAPAEQSLDFGGLRIAYDERVLTPRPWTAMQSRWAAELAATAGPGPVLELCTGAGHIGLLAAALSGRSLVAVDVDPVACAYAERNAAAAGLADRVEVRCASMADALGDGERFAMVIADPPWVPSAHVGDHPADPLLAIDGGDDGLDLARLCLNTAADHLLPDAPVLLQVGTDAQADELAAVEGWSEVGRRHGERGVVVALTATT